MSATWALVVSAFLLAGNAFFVAAEFALLASKPHRLEARAEAGSRSARAALEGTKELTVMLAGAQLGITVCTVGLGALAEPAIAHELDPLFAMLGLPPSVSYAIAFTIAMAIVVFLHMVVSEMAPKSWAISHPEHSAQLLALPFRAIAKVVYPLLRAMNAMANGVVRMLGVQPQATAAQAHGPEELNMLLRESREHGVLPEQQHRFLSGALRVQSITVADLMVARDSMVTVRHDATALDVEHASLTSGRSRLVVMEDDRPVGLVHVREAVTADDDTCVSDIKMDAVELSKDEMVATAATTMRRRRAQLALVTGADGEVVGLVALEDLLEQIMGRFDDETDRAMT
ncbi:MAG TPA: hemolysin family protein [Candidatus Stackebrandtia faecavium]|nr:hemolysin family protein [Candidatus Stackebrandtia faecavium]